MSDSADRTTMLSSKADRSWLTPVVGRNKFWIFSFLSVAVTAFMVCTLLWGAGNALLDLDIYRMAARAFVSGDDIYAVRKDGWRYIYPPITAMLFIPLAFIPLPIAGYLWNALGVAIVSWVFHTALAWLNLFDQQTRRIAALGGGALAVWFWPIGQGFYNGQINLLLMLLVMIDLFVLRNSRWCGALIGGATALKLSPGIFVVYLVLTRRYRACALAITTFVGMSALGFAIAPGQSAAYLFTVLPNTADVMGPPQSTASNSLFSVLVRLLGDAGEAVAPWIFLDIALALAGLALARYLWRASDELSAVSVCGLVTAVAVPIGWSHYWTWVLPGAIAVACHCWRARLSAGMAALMLVLGTLAARSYMSENLTSIPADQALDLPVLEQVQAASYLGCAVAFMVLAAYCARISRQAAAHISVSAPKAASGLRRRELDLSDADKAT